MVKRKQDSEPWAGTIVANVHYAKVNGDGEIVGVGPYIATEVEDERGFRFYALPDQMTPRAAA